MQWFNQLNQKEQLYVFVGAVCVVLYIGFQLIWRPLGDAQESLRVQNQNAAQSLQTIQAMAGEYKQLQASGAKVGNTTQNLPQLIDSTVAANGLRMSRFQPSASGDVQVRFDDVPFNKAVKWLADLEYHAVVIKDLSISAAAGAGLVNLSVRVH